MRSGEVVAGRFALEALAGAGGMGEVYRARDLELGGFVAVKLLLRASDAPRFEREARVLAELRSPAVVRYVAHGTDPAGQQWLAMEWLDGEDLQVRLARGPLSIAEGIALGRRLAEGLGAAHALGIVHRDVKPTNVLLEGGRPERASILDFGIARIGEGRTHTLTGAVLGTPGYLAPEQARGDVHVDARADVFALGSVLFEAIAGRPAFAGGNVMAVLTRILFEPAPRASEVVAGVPEALDALLAQMLEKDPAKRPANAGQIAAALEAIEVGASASTIAPAGRTIGDVELSLASVIVVRRGSGAVVDRVETEGGDVAAIARRFGARVEALLDGSIAALVSGAPIASDQASTAVRCALALRDATAAQGVGVATGGAVLGSAPRLGEIISRAANLAVEQAGLAGAIRLDEVTAGLLGDRFALQAVPDGALLLGENAAARAPRRCLGRDRELRMIEDLLAQTRDESIAQAFVIIGDAGIGKTSLVRAALASRPSSEVWTARGDPMREGASFAALAGALRSVMGGEPTAPAIRALAAETSDAEGTAEAVAEILGVPWGEPGPRLRAARSAPGLLADRVGEALVELVGARCRDEPLVWVVEDAHTCDAASIDVLDLLLRRLAQRPFVVIATGRPELDSRFPRLWAGRRVSRVQLGALSRRSAEAMARERLESFASSERVAEIVAQAEGNPFVLEELARSARTGAGGAPGSVHAMLHARFDALPSAVRRVLRAASVIGERIEIDGVRAIAGAAATPDALIALENEEILVRDGARRAFRHQLLRDVAYAMLTDEDRALAHRLAAEWLEREGEARAAALAEHWMRGGDAPRAADCSARAANEALVANDLAGALAHADRGIACGVDGESLGALLTAKAEASVWRGAIAEARDSAQRAMTLLPRGSRAWCTAMSVCATAEGRLGRHDALVALGRELADVVPETSAAGTLAVALARVVMHLFFAARFEDARAGVERLAELESRCGAEDSTIGARLAQTRAVEARYAGDPVAHLVWTERALASFEAIGDRRSACVLRANLGDGWKALGRWTEAERCMRATLESAMELGIGAVIAPVQLNLGVVLARQGRRDEALALLQMVSASFRESGDRRFEAAARIFASDVLLAAAQVDDAAAEIATAMTLLELESPYRPLALALESSCRRATGDVEGAVAAGRAAVAGLEALSGHAEEGELTAYLALAEALEAAGDREGARRAIEDAKSRLDAATAAIGDPEWRASFLDGVPEHRRICALALAWGVG